MKHMSYVSNYHFHLAVSKMKQFLSALDLKSKLNNTKLVYIPC